MKVDVGEVCDDVALSPDTPEEFKPGGFMPRSLKPPRLSSILGCIVSISVSLPKKIGFRSSHQIALQMMGNSTHRNWLALWLTSSPIVAIKVSMSVDLGGTPSQCLVRHHVRFWAVLHFNAFAVLDAMIPERETAESSDHRPSLNGFATRSLFKGTFCSAIAPLIGDQVTVLVHLGGAPRKLISQNCARSVNLKRKRKHAN